MPPYSSIIAFGPQLTSHNGHAFSEAVCDVILLNYMDLRESFRPRNKYITPERLLRSCQNFANVLANNQWQEPETRNVCITRSITHVLGRNIERQNNIPVENQYELENTSMRLTVEFEADKETLAEDADEISLLEVFVVTSVMVRTVQPEELPELVREQMIERLRNTVAEDIEAGVSTEDILRKFILEEKQSVRYVIDEDGEVDDYTTALHYLANGKKIVGKKYNHFSSVNKSAGVQNGWSNNGTLESYEYIDSEMDEKDVVKMIDDFDVVVGEINAQVDLERLIESAAPPEDEKRRRALAMIGLASSGMKGLVLATPKISLKNRLYDFLNFPKL